MRDPVILNPEEAGQVKRALGELNLSQATLAGRLELAQGTVSNFMMGKAVHRQKALGILEQIVRSLDAASSVATEVLAIRERVANYEKGNFTQLIQPIGPVSGGANCIRQHEFDSAPLPQQGFSFVVGGPQFGVSTALRSIPGKADHVRDTSALLLRRPEDFIDFVRNECLDESLNHASRGASVASKLSELLSLSRIASARSRDITFIVDDFHVFETEVRRIYYGIFGTLAANRNTLPIRGLIGVRKATWEEDTKMDYNPAERFPTLRLEAFSVTEIEDLLTKFNLPKDETGSLMEKFNGHPQKTHQAIWEMAAISSNEQK